MRRAVTLALLGLALLSGCKRHDDATSAPPSPVAAPTESKPLDHLAPNELAEGTEKAFGLTLPKGVHLDAQFPDQAWAHGDVSYTSLVEYVHTHVRGGSMMKRDDGAFFQKVSLPDDPKRVLSIRVQHRGEKSASLSLADETPPDLPPASPEEEMRQVGLSKDGKILDPKNLH